MPILFHSQIVNIGEHSCTVIVEGQVTSGKVVPGMKLAIPLNRSISISVLITAVSQRDDGWIRLLLGCESDDEAELVLALSITDEELEISEIEAASAPSSLRLLGIV